MARLGCFGKSLESHVVTGCLFSGSYFRLPLFHPQHSRHRADSTLPPPIAGRQRPIPAVFLGFRDPYVIERRFCRPSGNRHHFHGTLQVFPQLDRHADIACLVPFRCDRCAFRTYSWYLLPHQSQRFLVYRYRNHTDRIILAPVCRL